MAIIILVGLSALLFVIFTTAHPNDYKIDATYLVLDAQLHKLTVYNPVSDYQHVAYCASENEIIRWAHYDRKTSTLWIAVSDGLSTSTIRRMSIHSETTGSSIFLNGVIAYFGIMPDGIVCSICRDSGTCLVYLPSKGKSYGQEILIARNLAFLGVSVAQDDCIYFSDLNQVIHRYSQSGIEKTRLKGNDLSILKRGKQRILFYKYMDGYFCASNLDEMSTSTSSALRSALQCEFTGYPVISIEGSDMLAIPISKWEWTYYYIATQDMKKIARLDIPGALVLQAWLDDATPDYKK